MPEFIDPLNGIEFSEALAQAAVAADITDVRLDTYELWHPSMGEPYRIVNNSESIDAGLEDTAPRNAGETVHFQACYVQPEISEESGEAGARVTRLRVDNVSGEVLSLLRPALESEDVEIREAQWQIIERVYMLSDLSEPHIRPVFTVTATRVTIEGNVAMFTVATRDSANTAIPAITFTPERYPSLLL